MNSPDGSNVAVALASELPDGISIWRGASQVLLAATPRTELARALGAIGIQAADFDEWTSDIDGPLAATVSSSAVLTGLQRENPEGFSSVDLLASVVNGTGGFEEFHGVVRSTWRISDREFRRTVESVRAVSVAAVQAARIDGQPGHGVGATAPPVELPTSSGLAFVLSRADELRRTAALATITTSCLLRAMLPGWMTTDTREFLRGLGMGIQMATPAWLSERPEQPGTEIEPTGSHAGMFGVERYRLSDAASEAMACAFVLAERSGQRITMERLILGLLVTPGSSLCDLARRGLGHGVNLPLAYLLCGRQVAITPAEAELVVAFGEGTAEPVDVLDDLPHRVIRSLDRDLHQRPPAPSAWLCTARSRSAIMRWKEMGRQRTVESAGGSSTNYLTFLKTGNLASLREHLVDVPDSEFVRSTTARRLLRGDLPRPTRDELAEMAIAVGRNGALLPILGGLEPAGEEPTTRLGAKIQALAVQDWSADDLRVAADLGYSLQDLMSSAVDQGSAQFAAVTTMLEARLKLRMFRARNGLTSGLPGSGLSLVSSDLADTGDCVVTAYMDGTKACLTRIDAASRMTVRELPATALASWWGKYRRSCLRGEPTKELLIQLAQTTGLAELLDPLPSRPVRLCSAGLASGLPITQALAAFLSGHGIPVISHLGGGPFKDLFNLALAPSGHLAKRVAVLGPPAAVSASDLPFARLEADVLARFCEASTYVTSTQGSRVRILQIMEIADQRTRPLVWHFAAHGTTQPSADGELTAGVLVADDEILSTIDIGRLTQARVLICSACDIATMPQNSDFVSWPLAALAGGCNYVVAAPRPVSDQISFVAMLRMHSVWKEAETPIWQALTSAQHWMDVASLDEIEGFLDQFDLPSLAVVRALSAIKRERLSGDIGNQWAFATYTR